MPDPSGLTEITEENNWRHQVYKEFCFSPLSHHFTFVGHFID